MTKLTKTTRTIVGKLRRKIDRYADKAMSACGHDAEVEKANQLRREALAYITTEIDRLAVKAGEP